LFKASNGLGGSVIFIPPLKSKTYKE